MINTVKSKYDKQVEEKTLENFKIIFGQANMHLGTHCYFSSEIHATKTLKELHAVFVNALKQQESVLNHKEAGMLGNRNAAKTISAMLNDAHFWNIWLKAYYLAQRIAHECLEEDYTTKNKAFWDSEIEQFIKETKRFEDSVCEHLMSRNSY